MRLVDGEGFILILKPIPPLERGSGGSDGSGRRSLLIAGFPDV